MSELIHALQKERGAASIFLASNARLFADLLLQRVSASQTLEREVCARLESIECRFDGLAMSARFYSSVGYSLLALDTLPEIRTQVRLRALQSEDAVKSYCDVIAALLAVGFEAADVAADAETARALIALVNLSQGKEYAGQERALGGALLSNPPVHRQDKERLCRLVDSQERAFRVFSEYASATPAESYRRLTESGDSQLLARYRMGAFEPTPGCQVSAEDWYELTSRRIDIMKSIEQETNAELEKFCLAKLHDMEADESDARQQPMAARVAMLIAGIGGAPVLDGPADMFAAEEHLPAPLHSIRAVLEAQLRRIESINSERESTRQALAERKLVERAKGLLMQRRRLTERDAYTLMRQTAMSQNKRLIDIAEAVVSMAALL